MIYLVLAILLACCVVWGAYFIIDLNLKEYW